MERGSDRGSLSFGKRFGNDSDAKWKTVSSETARNGHAAKPHQIDKIGIGAEASIEDYRLRLNFFYFVDCRRRWQKEKVRASQRTPRIALQLS